MTLLLLTLLACKGEAPADTAPAEIDEDSDGFSVDEDCDDHNTLANPAAPELCDGVDNDCDGEIDEPDAVNAPTWYADADGDGAGIALATAVACEAPPGFASVAGDCDDADDQVSPLLPELCDGVDNDCDLAVDEPGAADAATWYPDHDGDGYGDEGGAVVRCEAPREHVLQAGDCDDSEARVAPGHRELCDGLDNDCDGVTDPDDADDAPLWHPDDDGDGYGVDEGAVASCEPPGLAWALATGDCDDGDGGVHPDAVEVCDGVDEDCDGVADGEDAIDASVWYADSDGDGFGDSDRALYDCEAPSGAVAADGDCDDGDSAVNPDGAEVCGDGVDNDCDGLSAPSCGPGGERSLALADARYLGISTDDGAGGALAAVGDVDGDGLDDLLIGAAGFDDDRGDEGVAYVVTGAISGSYDLTVAAARLIGADSGDAAGVAVAGAGDVDGDGLNDLVVGAWANDDGGFDAGAVYLVLSPIVGDLDLDDADAIWIGEAREDYAGGALAAAGDLDGDGLVDLAVGAIGSDLGGDYGGAVYILSELSAGGSLADAAGIREGEGRNDRAGDALSAAGDSDGDGLDDLIVGAWGDDDGGTGAGAAYLLLGPITGSASLSTADAKLIGEAWYDYAGDAVAGGGDVNGDGYDDFVVGARSNDRAATDAGASYLFLGPVPGDRDLGLADAILIGEADYDYAGYAVSVPGDVNADGLDDLLIGAHYEDSAGNASGAAYLVLGPISGTVPLSEADAKLTGQAAGDEAGAVLSGAGDVDGDGFDDLLVGAPGQDDGGSQAGAAHLIFGGLGL